MFLQICTDPCCFVQICIGFCRSVLIFTALLHICADLPCVVADLDWPQLFCTNMHWFLLICANMHWFLHICVNMHCVVADLCWSLLLLEDLHWSGLICTVLLQICADLLCVVADRHWPLLFCANVHLFLQICAIQHCVFGFLFITTLLNASKSPIYWFLTHILVKNFQT
jgi:hypothetical protein